MQLHADMEQHCNAVNACRYSMPALEQLFGWLLQALKLTVTNTSESAPASSRSSDRCR